MLGFINQFPYSDAHELNLDWVIATTKFCKDQVDYILKVLEEIEIMTKDQIEVMIQADIAANNQIIYDHIDIVKNQITNEYIAYVTNQINILRSYIDAQDRDLKIYVDNQDVYYNDLSQDYAAHAVVEANAYTDTKLIDYTYMISPVTGEYEDVRDVVTEIINQFLSEGSLTASEYDNLELTASAYDAFDLSAFDYDFNGKNILT